MNTEQTSSRPPRRWPGRKTVIAAGITAGLVLAGGTAVYAATDNSGPKAPGHGKGHRAAKAPRVLHGDLVVSQPDGSTAVERVQTGQVTAITDTSITGASKDGYTQTYTIDAKTALRNGKPATGQTVLVRAKVVGQTATATSIRIVAPPK